MPFTIVRKEKHVRIERTANVGVGLRRWSHNGLECYDTLTIRFYIWSSTVRY